MNLLLVGLTIVLAGCAQQSPPPGPTLMTIAGQPPGVDAACAGVGLSAVLRGSPTDPSLAWIETFPGGGGRREVAWPAGFSARFAPGLEILDATGRVVLRDGDFIEGACGKIGDRLLVSPPFLSLRLECGPLDVSDCTGGRIYQVATANGWPDRDIAAVQFLTADGRYRLTFADGSVVTGSSSQP
jgi:hypothetical protein